MRIPTETTAWKKLLEEYSRPCRPPYSLSLCKKERNALPKRQQYPGRSLGRAVRGCCQSAINEYGIPADLILTSLATVIAAIRSDKERLMVQLNEQ